MRAIGRFAALPFFSGCASRSSVATGTSISTTTQIREVKPNVARREESENKSSGFLVVLPNISNGVHKLVRTLKTFSQFFVLRKEEDEGVEEVEMEIGYPTDVKHVTHIGLDGSTTTTTSTTNTINNNNKAIIIKGWENNNLNNFVPPPHFLSFPPISLRQFELSMAAQTQPPLLHT